jgi:hypothetical protein
MVGKRTSSNYASIMHILFEPVDIMRILFELVDIIGNSDIYIISY